MKYEFDIAHCQVCLYVPEAEGSFPVIWPKIPRRECLCFVTAKVCAGMRNRYELE